ncbi:carbonic anhydrase 4-like [Xenentodon cancila]
MTDFLFYFKMYFISLVLCLALGDLVRCSSDWCYKDCDHTPSHWKDMPGNVCGGTKQSPVNILTGKVKTDPDLQNFTLNMFTSEQAVKSIMFNGHTVKCFLEEGDIEVSGGGLSGRYSALQFHFHWGQTDYTTHPGSEHTVDGHRYPMEMDIVTVKKGLTVSEATKHPDGLAVLGFFINATEEFEDTKMSEQWKWLTDYLTVITEKPEEVLVNHSISLEKLIGHVDLTKFYRYMGSLTTPNCTESVVWTVFHEPIQVKKDLRDPGYWILPVYQGE